MLRFALPAVLLCAIGVSMTPVGAQDDGFRDTGSARKALSEALSQQRSARARAEVLERAAAASRLSAEKSLKQAAALAARVQQAEAAAGAASAQQALVAGQRRTLDRQLAREREPVARLVGAIETLSRRPMTLALFQRGDLSDLVHTRAVLSGAMPVVERRTAGLRRDRDRVALLEQAATEALAESRKAQRDLSERRRQLVASAETARRNAVQVSGDAGREQVRALALGEQARDLDGLVGKLESAGRVRDQLAALPGPVLRPANPAAAAVQPLPSATSTGLATATAFLLPVEGHIVSGFGDRNEGGTRRRPGILLAPRSGAQVVAPGAGRIAFAGPYQGYGMIVIVEHASGWTSLLTGLGVLQVVAGQDVTAGSPIGRAGAAGQTVAFELRDGGRPVNPLDHLN